MMKFPEQFQHWFGGWPQLVCFDLDGTLIDSVPDLAQAIDSVLVEFECLPAGEARVRAWVGYGATKLVEQAMEWADIPPSSFPLFYDSFFQHYHSKLTDRTRLYSNVKSVLAFLAGQGIPLAVVTNKPSVFVAPILEHFDLMPYFCRLIGGDTFQEKKPSPLPLLQCCEEISVFPEQCLMVGDSLADHKAAVSAGFRSVLLTYGYHHDIDLFSLGADRVIDDLTELLT